MRNEAKNMGRLERWTRGEKLLLVVLGGVVFLDTLDLSLVQVALPAIGSELRLPDAQLQWIVSGFVLGYGGVPALRRPVRRRPRPQARAGVGAGRPDRRVDPRHDRDGRHAPDRRPLRQRR